MQLVLSCWPHWRRTWPFLPTEETCEAGQTPRPVWTPLPQKWSASAKQCGFLATRRKLPTPLLLHRQSPEPRLSPRSWARRSSQRRLLKPGWETSRVSTDHPTDAPTRRGWRNRQVITLNRRSITDFSLTEV